MSVEYFLHSCMLFRVYNVCVLLDSGIYYVCHRYIYVCVLFQEYKMHFKTNQQLHAAFTSLHIL